MRSPGEAVKHIDSLGPAQPDRIRLGRWEGISPNLNTSQFPVVIQIHTDLKTTALFFDHLVQPFSNFLNTFNPLMAKMHIISIISTVDGGRFSYTFRSPFVRLFMMHHLLEIPNREEKKKLLIKNYSVCLWHHLAEEMSSRIWILTCHYSNTCRGPLLPQSSHG